MPTIARQGTGRSKIDQVQTHSVLSAVEWGPCRLCRWHEEPLTLALPIVGALTRLILPIIPGSFLCASFSVASLLLGSGLGFPSRV